MTKGLHRAWRVAVILTICAGLFHLINLAGPGRSYLGLTLVTPFRAAFAVAWIILVAELMASRRRPCLDIADGLVAAFAALYLLRGIFYPETFGIAFNWVFTGAGVFYLVKHGIRDRHDLRLVVVTVSLAIVAIAFTGLFEYAVKSNPLFESIQIDAVGNDSRIEASDQFYRVRSLVGHPGFVGAILGAGVPLIMLTFWRRRLLMAVLLAAAGMGLFLSFSRGSWLLIAIFLMPVLAYRGRYWIKRNAQWLAALLIALAIFITVDYLRREEISFRVDRQADNGLTWVMGREAPLVGGEAEGMKPGNNRLYFNVSDSFYLPEDGSATVIVHYFDTGTGPVYIEYRSRDEAAGRNNITHSGHITKTDSKQWTNAAFFLERPNFDGSSESADFRIVDDDSQIVLDEVVLQKGKLKLPSVVAQQWRARAGSFDTRADFFPLAWSVLLEHPLGVGLFNSPGTNHHAVDSLPLTWIMELGWPAFALLGFIVLAAVREGLNVLKAKRGPAVAIYLSIMFLMLHSVHLMILYDKPSLVLFSVMAAVYTLIRPWRRQGAILKASNEDFMI